MGGSLTLEAQIDPEKRRLLQLGYNQPLQGRGPISGYAFYYWNQPNFLKTNLTLRLAVAPVYLDSELGIGQALSPYTDLALGLAGGGFADSYSEVRRGKLLEEESFTGHGGDATLSVYHLFNSGQRIPFNGVLRGIAHFSSYERDEKTAPGFKVPDDRATFHLRAGLRWGGREPLMEPSPAMELSAWYEGQFRDDAELYGYAGDRNVVAASHLFWGRALLAYTLPELKHYFSANLTAGTSINPDRFSGYRLGGSLPLISEFPLNLPGYYFQEISARRFVLLSGQYSLPLDQAKRWGLTAFGTSAVVDYLPGLEQAGDWHSGVGGGISYRSPNAVWQIALGYAYGIDAIRTHGRGAHSIGILLQYDYEARQSEFHPGFNPNKWRGFDRIFGR